MQRLQSVRETDTKENVSLDLIMGSLTLTVMYVTDNDSIQNCLSSTFQELHFLLNFLGRFQEYIIVYFMKQASGED